MGHYNSKASQEYFARRSYGNSYLGKEDVYIENRDLINYAKTNGVTVEQLADYLSMPAYKLWNNLRKQLQPERMIKYYKAVDSLIALKNHSN